MKIPELAIVAEDVYKHYTGAAEGTGLNGFNLVVQKGSIYALLGPNGAGKTTAVRILATLLRLNVGRAIVAGFDVTAQPQQVRERIGLVGQYAAVDEVLTGRQNLMLFGRLHHLSTAAARQRADELLDQFSLREASERPVHTYSGGMRRRLDLAASFIVTPAVLFVDEPTTGLDPAARQDVWGAIRGLVDAGTTVLLTTQYLEEADQLADRISFLKGGRVIAEGTSGELKRAIGPDWLDIALANAADTEVALSLVAPIADGELVVDSLVHHISVPVTARTKALVEVVSKLQAAQIEPHDIALRRPTLDEVFLHLTNDTPQPTEVNV